MPAVTVTAYEYENDLLPMVCGKCGRPAEVHVARPVRFFEEREGLKTAALVGGLIFFPPLFLLIAYRYAEEIRVRVPMCETHQNDWRWRDRATYCFLMPTWTLTVLLLYGVCIMYLIKGDEENAAAAFIAVPAAIVVVALIENLVIHYGTVRLLKEDKTTDVRLRGVHADFVAAIAEERARDRVDNPKRRPIRQRDMRDDFDDEPS